MKEDSFSFSLRPQLVPDDMKSCPSSPSLQYPRCQCQRQVIWLRRGPSEPTPPPTSELQMGKVRAHLIPQPTKAGVKTQPS